MFRVHPFNRYQENYYLQNMESPRRTKSLVYFCTAATNQLGFFDTISPPVLHSFWLYKVYLLPQVWNEIIADNQHNLGK